MCMVSITRTRSFPARNGCLPVPRLFRGKSQKTRTLKQLQRSLIGRLDVGIDELHFGIFEKPLDAHRKNLLTPATSPKAPAQADREDSPASLRFDNAPGPTANRLCSLRCRRSLSDRPSWRETISRDLPMRSLCRGTKMPGSQGHSPTPKTLRNQTPPSYATASRKETPLLIRAPAIDKFPPVRGLAPPQGFGVEEFGQFVRDDRSAHLCSLCPGSRRFPFSRLFRRCFS